MITNELLLLFFNLREEEEEEEDEKKTMKKIEIRKEMIRNRTVLDYQRNEKKR